MRIDRQKNIVTFIEMTCETDFVAKTDKFQQGVEAVLETLQGKGASLEVHAKEMGNAVVIDGLIN